MEAFRRKLKNQRTCVIIAEVIFAVILVINFLGDIDIIPIFDYMQGDEAWKESYPGKLGSFIFTILVINGASIRNISKALKDEEQLKERYIQSTDELQRTINIRTSSTTSRIMYLVEFFGMLIAGYFSKVIALTIFAILALNILVVLICDTYYRKKYS